MHERLRATRLADLMLTVDDKLANLHPCPFVCMSQESFCVNVASGPTQAL